jgi:hypothetical protein
MKLYTSKVPTIAQEVIQTLVRDGDIEISDPEEAKLDVEAVLKEYVRLDRELTDQAKDVLEQRRLDYGQFGKIKRALAEERGIGLGEEAITWITTQTLETFMQSAHVEEVFADDATLRRKVRDILKKHMAVDEELDAEVRRRIKNLQEGTQTWDLEYAKVMEQIRRKHGIQE